MAIETEASQSTTQPRRISYVLPPVSPLFPPPRLELPQAPGAGRHISRTGKGSSNPIIRKHADQPTPASNKEGSGEPDCQPRHALPVTSLAIDPSTSVYESQGTSNPKGLLYTAGRDGLVASWELGLQMRKRRPRPLRYSSRHSFGSDEDDQSEDESPGSAKVYRDGTPRKGQSGRSEFSSQDFQGHETPTGWEFEPFEMQWEIDEAWLRTEKAAKPQARFRSCVQSHTDWINDMVLCNSNQTVVTAGSDRFLRTWNPHDPASCLTPTVLGSHSDYVKTLARPVTNDAWLASGSLDQRVRLWDLHEARTEPVVDIFDSHSVYSLATDARGGIIAVGTPENGIRLYDPRQHSASTGPVGRLLGHTDMIRSMLISSSGRNLLSSSSDGTVRLWDVGEQRLTHTFRHHSTSVTSLFSNRDDLSIFYSADRDGIVCKVDCQDCAEPDEGECVVIAQTGSSVNKVIALDDAFVWTSGGGSNVKCWRDVPPRRVRQQQYPIHGGLHSYSESSDRPEDLFLQQAEPSPRDQWATFADKQEDETPISATSVDTPDATLTPISPLRSGSKSPLPSALKTTHSSGSNAGASRPPRTTSDSPRSPPLTNHQSHVSFSIDNARAASNSSVPAQPASGTSMLFGDVHPAATLFGIPFDSLVTLGDGDDPYGLGTGLGTNGAFGTGTGIGSVISLRGSAMHLASQISTPGETGAHSRSSLGGRNSLAIEGVPAASMNMARLAQLRAAGAAAAARSLTGDGSSFHLHGGGRRSFSTSARFLASDRRRGSSGLGHDSLSTSPFVGGGLAPGQQDGVEQDDEAMLARRAYEERETALKATPLQAEPVDVIYGTRGLIRSCMLNDRRHVLTYSPVTQEEKAAEGETSKTPEIALWDVLRCRCVGVFYGPEIAALLSVRDTPGDVLEKVRSFIEGFGANQAWCSVDTRNGSLAVHLDASSVFDAEMYLDECEWVDVTDIPRPDQRVNLGKWLLRSLFAGFIQAEATVRNTEQPLLKSGELAIEHADAMAGIEQLMRHAAPPSLSQRRPRAPASVDMPKASGWNGDRGPTVPHTPGNTIGLAVAPRTPALTPKSTHPSTPGHRLRGSPLPTLLENNATATPSSSHAQRSLHSSDYFSFGSASKVTETSTVGQNPESPRPSTRHEVADESTATPGLTTPGGSLMSRWGSKFRGKDKISGGGGSNSGDKSAARKATVKDDGAQAAEAGELHAPASLKDSPTITRLRDLLTTLTPVHPMPFAEAPPMKLPPDTSVMVSAASGEAAQWESVYRGLVSSTSMDFGELELVSPSWLLEFLLANKSPAYKASGSAAPKMSFVLHPASSEVDEDGQARAMLPALPSGDAKLTATKMIRLTKVAQYICEKLGYVSNVSFTSSSPSSAAHSRAASIIGGSRRPSAENLATTALLTGVQRQTKQLQMQQLTQPEPDLEPLTPGDLELTCNGVVLDPYTTLIQVARFYWKASGDVKLEYRRRQE